MCRRHSTAWSRIDALRGRGWRSGGGWKCDLHTFSIRPTHVLHPPYTRSPSVLKTMHYPDLTASPTEAATMSGGMVRGAGEVFGLVAMRDLQRRVTPGTLWAPACNLITPPEFRQAPRAAHGIAALGSLAYRYMSAEPQRHRFVAAFQDAAEILHVLGCPRSAAVPRIAARRWSGDCHDGRRSQAQDLSSGAALDQSGYFLRQLRMESAEDIGDRLQFRTSRNRRSLPAFGCKGMRKGRYGLGRIESLSAAIFSRAGKFGRAGIS